MGSATKAARMVVSSSTLIGPSQNGVRMTLTEKPNIQIFSEFLAFLALG